MTTWKVFGTFMLLLFTLMTLLLLLFFSPLERSAIPNHPYYATIFILHIDLLYLTIVLKNYMFGVPRIRNKRSLIRRTEGIWQVVYHDEERCLYNAVNFLQNAHNKHSKLARECEIWGVCCDYNIWFTFCHCYRSVVCNTVINQAAL